MRYEVEHTNGTKEIVNADTLYVADLGGFRDTFGFGFGGKVGGQVHHVFTNTATERYRSDTCVASFTEVKAVRPHVDGGRVAAHTVPSEEFSAS